MVTPFRLIKTTESVSNYQHQICPNSFETSQGGMLRSESEGSLAGIGYPSEDITFRKKQQYQSWGIQIRLCLFSIIPSEILISVGTVYLPKKSQKLLDFFAALV